jgi:peroxiredoxin
MFILVKLNEYFVARDYLKTTEGDILIIQFGSGKFTDG